MLTLNEKEWLKNRMIDLKSPGAYSCGHCEVQCFTLEKSCPLVVTSKDWKEAAEFEARVAAKLASKVDACPYVTMPMSKHCMRTGCVACKLRDARLEVEEEMDNENR